MTLIFSITFLLFVAVVAYFHYIQSAFSAVLSAIFAALASVLAVGYYQSLANVGGAPLGAYGDAVAMAAIFAITYTVLRVAFDKFVPGNLTLPVTLDRILAVCAGIVAGVFCVGTAATAVQLLPFGASIAYYSPYPIEDRSATGELPTIRQRLSLTRFNELQVESFDPAQRKGMILPVDEWVVSVATHVSDGGSMAGGSNLARVSPSFLDNVYGQRLGLQAGDDLRLPVGVADKNSASVKSVFRIVDDVPQVSGEMSVIRKEAPPARWTPDGGKSLLVVRVAVADDAGGKNGLVSFAPAAVRFTANRNDYYAIGTMSDSGVLVRNVLDDFVLVEAGSEMSLVFEVDNDVFANADGLLVDDALVTVKRYGRLPVGGATATAFARTSGDGVLRKTEVQDAITAAGGPARNTAPANDAEAEADADAAIDSETGTPEGLEPMEAE